MKQTFPSPGLAPYDVIAGARRPSGKARCHFPSRR
jgi:hypothetical protein